jgi:hypothetical protein
MRRGSRRSLLLVPLCLVLGFGLLGAAPPGSEQEAVASDASPQPPAAELSRMRNYEPDRAGHPLRVVAYVVHPVGVILDYAIFRPAYWIGSHEPLRTLFGQGSW